MPYSKNKSVLVSSSFTRAATSTKNPPLYMHSSLAKAQSGASTIFFKKHFSEEIGNQVVESEVKSVFSSDLYKQEV